jgi:hypothetical protein
MSLAANQRIVDEIRLIRAEREARFRCDLEEIDRQYDRDIGDIRAWRMMSRAAARELFWAFLFVVLPLATILISLLLN